ncbi:MAG: AAA family ATPase, partial [bacterium]|nr:AAA family ATPase [bacterium]
MSLANITRPKSWNEVIGQPTVISILQRQVATKRWKNAYLFCGAHGCGKTTVARIFANAINDGSGFPIEIDGASNNGVDSIRAIINDAQQVSLECDFKVYIIDECHMITSAGWNAALKLIEEPPVGTVFIFCTTNPEKLPGTILSRVQRFDFKKVSSRDITNHLEYLLNEYAKCNYEKEALDVIASNADGHVRDA